MFGHDAISEAYIMSDEYKKKLEDAEEVYGKYTDTAGNLHWTGTHSGTHIIRAGEDETDFYTKGHLHLGYAEEDE